MIEEPRVECPYCGEPFTTFIDWSGGERSYIEDCPVCCRPVEFRLRTDMTGEPAGIDVRRDDD